MMMFQGKVKILAKVQAYLRGKNSFLIAVADQLSSEICFSPPNFLALGIYINVVHVYPI